MNAILFLVVDNVTLVGWDSFETFQSRGIRGYCDLSQRLILRYKCSKSQAINGAVPLACGGLSGQASVRISGAASPVQAKGLPQRRQVTERYQR